MSFAPIPASYSPHILFVSRDIILSLDLSQALEAAGLPPGKHVNSLGDQDPCPFSCLAIIVDASDLNRQAIDEIRKKLRTGVPVFVIANNYEEAEIFELGDDARFLKPFVADELVNVMRPLLSEHHYDRAG